MSSIESSKDDEVVVALPGFRFYPSDEELVAFYLRRKVENKPTRIELIKQIDIYKYDPWDLPKAGTVGDKEWYFFCKRGRKYRNSVRPNRVTGSGFWKATGIDKPVYSGEGAGHDCIGLKKSLVYYRGSAGKGTKTDWMMHEFRLPAEDKNTTNYLPNAKCTNIQEAEVWTLCRIFKRNASYKKYTPNICREILAKRDVVVDTSSKTSSMDSDNRENYISFEAPVIYQNDTKPINIVGDMISSERNQYLSSITAQPPFMATSSSIWNPDVNDFFTYQNCDELRSVVEFAFDPFLM